MADFSSGVQFALRKLSSAPAENHAKTASMPFLAADACDSGNGAIGSFLMENNLKEETWEENDRNSLKNGQFQRVKNRRSSDSSAQSFGDKGLTLASSDPAKRALLSALSGLYAILLIILSSAFEISIVVVDSVDESKYDFFYIYLYGLSLSFFGYCYAYLLKTTTWKETFVTYCCWLKTKPWRKTHSDSDISVDEAAALFLQNPRLRRTISEARKVTHSAPTAGSLYLRLGCVVFGVVGLIAKGLQLFAVFDHAWGSGCIVWTSVVETTLVMIFLFVQMFFIFQNNKLVIHRFKSIGRLGLMHLIATNLCTWIRSIVQEQFEVIEEIREGLHHASTHISAHDRSSAMNGLIQINFATNVTAHHPHQQDARVDPRRPISIFAQNASSCYSTSRQQSAVGTLISDVKPFMITCIIEYSLICAAVMYILWRNVGKAIHDRHRSRKQRFHVDCSSSTRGLFIGLLFMVFTIVSMVIFFTKTRSEESYQALWVFYASDSLLYAVSIVALLLGLLRIRHLYYAPDQKNTVLLDDILLIVGLVGQLMFCVFSVVPLNSGSLTASMVMVTSLLRIVEVLLQTIFIFFGQRLSAVPVRGHTKNPGREMVTFLLMTNLSMFLINTFETHKAGANPLTSEFYGESIWTVIVYSTVPLSIFYRFHSTVCLAEIWKHAYRFKTSAEAV